MKLRTIAIALALACGFTATVEAKAHKYKPNAKHRVKIRKPGKVRKPKANVRIPRSV
ncbi:MAG: hypothetical protein JO099_10705 [Acidobacteriia bacterium]|nr:hypothetical protein [Terriglobia bacterium]